MDSSCVTPGPFDKQDCNADSAHLRAMRATSLLCFPSSFADLEDEQDEEEPVVFKGWLQTNLHQHLGSHITCVGFVAGD